MLLAKRLLTDSQLSIAEVAFASGFSSVRRLNVLFKERYRLRPTDLRKTQRQTSRSVPETLRCELAYRPPFHWAKLLDFLAGRAIAGVEQIERDRYQRTVQIGSYQGWICVSPIPTQDKLQVELSVSLVAAILPVLTRVKALFDLAADPVAIAAHLEQANWGQWIPTCAGLRVPGAFDGFEVAVRAILGLQVSVNAATTLMGRVVQTFGSPLQTPRLGLAHLTPTAAQLATAEVTSLTSLGIVSRRAQAIVALAQAVVRGELQLVPYADVDVTVERLKALPGIGDWTAQYIAMRVLAYPDAFPHSDLVLRQRLGVDRPQQVWQMAEAWRPWRAYAAMCLWTSLEAVK